jgi:hypothetical protein
MGRSASKYNRADAKKRRKPNILSVGHMVNYNCTRFLQNNKPGFSICTSSSRSSPTPGRFSGNALSFGNRPHADILEWTAGWPPWISIGRRIARAVSPSSGRVGRRNGRGRPPLAALPRLACHVVRTPMVLAPPTGSHRTTGGTFPPTGPSATLCPRPSPTLPSPARPSTPSVSPPFVPTDVSRGRHPREVRTTSLILNKNS